MKIKNIFIFMLVLAFLAFSMVWTFRHGGVLQMQREAMQKLPDRPDFSFTKVLISEISGQQKFWEIRSERSVIDKNLADLQDLDGIIYENNKRTLKFRSPKAFADLDQGNFRISKVVAQTYKPVEDPWQLSADLLIWNRHKGLMEGRKNVRVWRKKMFFKGDHLLGETELNVFSLQKNAQGIISRNKPLSKDPEKDISGNIIIKAEEMIFDGKTKYIQASRNVILDSPSLNASGEYLYYNNSNEDFTLQEKVKISYRDRESGALAKLTAKKANYLSKDQQLLVSSDVKFSYTDIKCQSDNAVFYQKEEYFTFFGNVKAQDAKKHFFGNKVTIYLEPKRIVTEGRSKFVAPK